MAAPDRTDATAGGDDAGVPSLLLYRIHFDVDHLGQNRPQSKRRAVWRYGISQADRSAVKRHEAVLTWSTHSGKYTIAVDGEEVFAGVAKGSVLEYKWTWSHARARIVLEEEDNGVADNNDIVAMRIIACRKPPVRSSKDFRCYEFLISGKVFRDLPVHGSNEETGGSTNEDVCEDGKLASILDIVEPGWRASGFA